MSWYIIRTLLPFSVRPKLNVKPSVMKPAVQVKPGPKRRGAERSAVAAVKPLNSTSTVLEEPLQDAACRDRQVGWNTDKQSLYVFMHILWCEWSHPVSDSEWFLLYCQVFPSSSIEAQLSSAVPHSPSTLLETGSSSSPLREDLQTVPVFKQSPSQETRPASTAAATETCTVPQR